METAIAAAATVLAKAWEPHCCVILLTDGASSTHAVSQVCVHCALSYGIISFGL